MSDALTDIRREFRELHGHDPDPRLETLLSRVWHDGKEAGRAEAFDVIAEFVQEVR